MGVWVSITVTHSRWSVWGDLSHPVRFAQSPGNGSWVALPSRPQHPRSGGGGCFLDPHFPDWAHTSSGCFLFIYVLLLLCFIFNLPPISFNTPCVSVWTGLQWWLHSINILFLLVFLLPVFLITLTFPHNSTLVYNIINYMALISYCSDNFTQCSPHHLSRSAIPLPLLTSLFLDNSNNI